MPGPMSTPKGWTETTKRNKSGSHGATKTGFRKSGKTQWKREHK